MRTRLIPQASMTLALCSFLWLMPQAQGQQIDTLKPGMQMEPRVTVAALTGAAETRGDDIVTFANIYFTVPVDGIGGSVQWDTGAQCECDTPPHNFNIWTSGGNAAFYWPIQDVAGGVSLDNGVTYAVLQEGDTIGPDDTFMLSTPPAATTNWRQASGVDGYLGFRFVNPATSEVNYGYVHLILTGTTGHPATIVGWSYNQVGDPITIGGGEVPPPSASVDPASLEFNFDDEGGADSQELTLSNTADTGADALEYSISVIADGEAPHIVSVSPNSGSVDAGDSVTLTVSVDVTDVAPGKYDYVIEIETNDPDNPVLEVEVSVAITTSTEGGSNGLSFDLFQNYPNPFNGVTTVEFELPYASHVTIEVLDVMGRRVALLVDDRLEASSQHTVTWDASGVSSGVYLYRMVADGFTKTLRTTVVN